MNHRYNQTMSTPQTQSTVESETGSQTGTTGSQISFKKHTKIKNEISSQRRQALKEFYKLQKQQSELQSKSLPQTAARAEAYQDSDDELETEVRSGKAVPSLDLLTSSFKQILKHVNKLSSSVNLINSDIKNIIYDNYYELIKLNDFLKDMGSLKVETKSERSEVKGGLLDILKGMGDSTHNNHANDNNIVDLDSSLTKLQDLMANLDDFNSKDYKTAGSDLQEQDSMKTSLNLLNLKNVNTSSEDLEKYQESLQSEIDKAIEELEKENEKEILIDQLKGLAKLKPNDLVTDDSEVNVQ